MAALNLAIGLNIGLPTGVIETADVPPFTTSLAECLQAAVASRREFQVAHRSVQVAAEGARIAEADFSRKVWWRIPEQFSAIEPACGCRLGGWFYQARMGTVRRRQANCGVACERLPRSRSHGRIRVDCQYHRIPSKSGLPPNGCGAKGIDRSRPAVEQTRETYRLVAAQSLQGDATPAELTDAEVALTRAQQDSSNAIYDYLIAIARLEYTMGISPVPR